MFPSINRQRASSLQKSDSPAHHKALGAEWTSVSEIRPDAFVRAGWEKLVENLAQDFAKDDEQEDDRDYSDLLMQAEEWVDYDMSGACLEPDAPVIVVSGESL
jgi:hypothetical protein